MNRLKPWARYGVAVLGVLLFSAAWSRSAHAEETQPPAEETVAVEDGLAEGTVEAAEPTPAETRSGVEEAAPVARAAEETSVVVLVADPAWCPTGVVPGSVTCFSAVSLSALLTTDVPDANGVIWIQSGLDSGGNVDISGGAGGTWASAKNYTLTFQGGWDGVPGSTTTYPTDPSVFSGTHISVLDWNADLTFNDIVIDGALMIGLEVGTSGSIKVNRVKSGGNGGMGAYLGNAPATAPVVVTASEFNHNADDGLVIDSRGAVTLNDVTASENGTAWFGIGAIIDNQLGTAGVTLLGTNVFNDNDKGLSVSSSGAISVQRLVASGNTGGDGANLYNAYSLIAAGVTITGPAVVEYNGSSGLGVYSNGAIKIANLTAAFNDTGAGLYNDSAGFASNVTLTGTNRFEANADLGLEVQSYGNISLGNVSALGNGTGGTADGVHLVNAFGSAAKPVTLSGTNTFSGNSGIGLDIDSRGLVTLSSVTARANGGQGAEIDNTFAPTSAPQNIVLSGTNTFTGNAFNGLEVWSHGSITVNNLIALQNGTGTSNRGARLDNTGGILARPVTLTGTSRVEDNGGIGISVFSLGAIKINNLTASYNGTSGVGYGAWLINSSAPSAQPVILTGTNTFDGNWSDGLLVTSRGAITAANLHAGGSLTGTGVSLNNHAAGPTTPQNVTVSGSSSFYGNYTSGLMIGSYGAVSLSNLRAGGNGASLSSGWGVYVGNEAGSLPKPVTISGTSMFTGNWYDGLTVVSLGAITVQNVTAGDNGAGTGGGVTLSNSFPGASGGITVSGTLNRFEDNSGDGLYVNSRGVISLSNLRAGGNGWGMGGGYGVRAVNIGATAPMALNITGLNVLEGNVSGGLFAEVTGPIVAYNLTSNDAVLGNGATLDNDALGSTMPQNVTLIGAASFSSNYGNGLFVATHGAVTTGGITATGNGFTWGDGVFIDNHGGSLPKPVTLNGFNVFSGNHDQGLEIQSLGVITVRNITAMGNDTAEGAYLYNGYPGTSAGVNVTGDNLLVTNANIGLSVWSYGPISVSNITAQFNGSAGASLDNSAALTAQPITLSGSNNVSANVNGGLGLYSTGKVLINNLTANDNGTTTGAYIDNTAAPDGSPQPVSLTGTSTFLRNNREGVVIYSEGAITLNNITASGNGTGLTWGPGIVVDNETTGGSPQKVTIAGVNIFSENLDTGLWVDSLGVISVANVSAIDNGAEGVYLSNDFPGAVGGVTMSGVNSFVLNGGSGLEVFSRGAISVSSILSDGNAGYGASLSNYGADPLTPQKVTLSGTNVVNNNQAIGLQITSRGQISINNLSARWNSQYGAFADNRYAGSSAGIVLTGVNTFIDNTWTGLALRSNGAVSVANVTADDNGGNGVYILADGNVTVACAWLNGNSSNGLSITTPAVITLKGIFTAANGGLAEVLVPGYADLIRIRNCS